MAYLGGKKMTGTSSSTRGVKQASARVKAAMASKNIKRGTTKTVSQSKGATLKNKMAKASNSSRGTNRSIGTPKPGKKGANSYG